MNKSQYFYQFLEPISKELALLARELEYSIFSSPRTMLTHSRVFVENILKHVMVIEKVQESPQMTLIERITILNEKGFLVQRVNDSLHNVRKVGNEASHDSRMFRYSESLLSWEALYTIVKWYIECYGPLQLTVPDYQEPSLPKDGQLDIGELIARLKALEDLLSTPVGQPAEDEVAAAVEEATESASFTPVRELSYKESTLSIPYFLRDAFLLPQRFPKSETFLIRLGEVQQARFMSELPSSLIDLHKQVKRYNEKNDQTLFEELNVFVQEEVKRNEISDARRGELLFFYKDDYIVVTEELSDIPLSGEEFIGIPSLIRQLNENGIMTVGQLPKELVILAKYNNVGIGTVEKLFEQLKSKQKSR
ncbi:DUF4145 domain-containing protein [Fictibacillus aquaticus]|uniref:Transposase n=1 Tax=Fictibacillus aquaticus TaxID=2021314 RepID=A0A235F834_9BACL|nr:DUF4145 domain-containing protein [Fictibacillus aquaticus]OYD57203.1 transposase [Fictibacillus aquaticus]